MSKFGHFDDVRKWFDLSTKTLFLDKEPDFPLFGTVLQQEEVNSGLQPAPRFDLNTFEDSPGICVESNYIPSD